MQRGQINGENEGVLMPGDLPVVQLTAVGPALELSVA